MTDVTPPPMTFAAYAARIGKSRPYISKLVAQGTIRPPALTADRLILADLADEQRAEAADPARGGTESLPASVEASYARERTRKTSADAARAEIELAARKGELVDAAGVTRATEDLFRRVVAAVMAVPDAVAPDLARLGEEGAIAGHLTLRLEAALDDARRGIADAVGRAA